MDYKSTLQVAKILGVTVGRLSRAVWDGRIPAPTKGPGRAFLWTTADINRASKELLSKVYIPASADIATPSKPRQLAQGIANVG